MPLLGAEEVIEEEAEAAEEAEEAYLETEEMTDHSHSIGQEALEETCLMEVTP